MATPRPKRRNLIFKFCIFAFAAYAVVLLIDMQVALAARKRQLIELEQQYEEQRIANKELERQIMQGSDEEYIEQIARERLDYVEPDEKVYIDISGN